MIESQFPVLSTGDTAITPVSGFAWAVFVQQESDADRAITEILGREKERIGKREPCATCGQMPALPPLSFNEFPVFSNKGVGMFAIPDCAWQVLVRRGSGLVQGPNPTEAALMAYVQKFGQKRPR